MNWRVTEAVLHRVPFSMTLTLRWLQATNDKASAKWQQHKKVKFLSNNFTITQVTWSWWSIFLSLFCTEDAVLPVALPFLLKGMKEIKPGRKWDGDLIIRHTKIYFTKNRLVLCAFLMLFYLYRKDLIRQNSKLPLFLWLFATYKLPVNKNKFNIKNNNKKTRALQNLCVYGFHWFWMLLNTMQAISSVCHACLTTLTNTSLWVLFRSCWSDLIEWVKDQKVHKWVFSWYI